MKEKIDFMQPFEYRVLAYAKSDLDVDCTDFAVVIRVPVITIGSVMGIVLDCWQHAIPDGSREDAEYIEDFLHDLRQQALMDRDASDGLFEGIEQLNIGPMRTLSSGTFQSSCLPAPLDRLVNSTLGVQMCSQGTFDSLIGSLRGSDKTNGTQAHDIPHAAESTG